MSELNLKHQKLGAEQDDYYRSHQPSQVNAPYLSFARENMILCKDGSLLALFEYDGVDGGTVSTGELAVQAGLLDQAMNMLNGRITLWWHQHHKIIKHYPAGEYDNPVSAKICEIYKSDFFKGKHYKNDHYLAVLYTPQGGIDKFFDKVSFYTKQGKMSVWNAVWHSLKDVLSYRSAFAFDYHQLQESIKEFEEILSNFTGSLPMFKLRPLILSDALSYLHRIINPASDGFKVRLPRGGSLFDGYLPDNYFTVGANQILAEGNAGNRYVAAVTIKDYPKYSEPQMLEMLAQVDGDIMVSHIFRLLDHSDAKSAIGDAARYHRMVALPLYKRIVAMMFKKEPAVNSHDYDQMHEAEEALASITNDRKKWCEHNITVLIYGKTRDECDQVTQNVANALNQSGFIAIRETTALQGAWSSTLPGNWHMQPRRQLVSVSNLSDLVPISTMQTGKFVNEWLSEQSGMVQEAHTAFRTKQLIPYFFNFHRGSLGHTITIGPAGAGKTVFESLLIALYQKYKPFTFVFDKDYSCKIPIIMQGGGYIDIKNNKVQFNPLSLLDDQKHWAWLASWMESLLTSRGERYSTEHEKKVWEAINTVAGLPKESWQLSLLAVQLGTELQERMEMWIGNGRYGYLFDNPEDTFDMSDMTGLEMGHLMQNHPIAAAVFMDYAFYRLDLKLDGSRPGIINIQEFWFMLTNEKFAARLDDWSRTMRKRNVVIMLSTQSLKEINESEYAMSFIDNYPNRILLPNASARTHEKIYKSMFGLTDHQIDQISSAIPQRNYYLTTPDITRMLEVPMSKELLAHLRADGKALQIFKHHEDDGTDGWRDRYLAEVVA